MNSFLVGLSIGIVIGGGGVAFLANRKPAWFGIVAKTVEDVTVAAEKKIADAKG